MVSRNWILDEVPRKKTAHARRNARGPKLRIPRESDARKRETINIRGQRRASIFRIPALFLRSGAYVCVRACCYIHTYSPIYRGGNLEISRSPRVVSCAYRDACVVRSLLLPPRTPRFTILFFSLFFLFLPSTPLSVALCNELRLRAKKTTLVPRGHWPGPEEARSAIGPSTRRRWTKLNRAEPSRAEPIHQTGLIYIRSCSPSILCIVDLDGALTAVPFP